MLLCNLVSVGDIIGASLSLSVLRAIFSRISNAAEVVKSRSARLSIMVNQCESWNEHAR